MRFLFSNSTSLENSALRQAAAVATELLISSSQQGLTAPWEGSSCPEPTDVPPCTGGARQPAPLGGSSYFERVEDRIVKAVERGSAAARDLSTEK